MHAEWKAFTVLSIGIYLNKTVPTISDTAVTAVCHVSEITFSSFPKATNTFSEEFSSLTLFSRVPLLFDLVIFVSGEGRL